MPAEPFNQAIPQGGEMPTSRIIKLPEDSKLNTNIILELDCLLDLVPAERLSRCLRDLFLIALAQDREIMLGWPFEKMPEDLFFLLQFLDATAEELKAA